MDRQCRMSHTEGGACLTHRRRRAASVPTDPGRSHRRGGCPKLHPGAADARAGLQALADRREGMPRRAERPMWAHMQDDWHQPLAAHEAGELEGPAHPRAWTPRREAAAVQPPVSRRAPRHLGAVPLRRQERPFDDGDGCAGCEMARIPGRCVPLALPEQLGSNASDRWEHK